MFIDEGRLDTAVMAELQRKRERGRTSDVPHRTENRRT